MQGSFSLRKNAFMNTYNKDDIALNRRIIERLNDLMNRSNTNPTELARLTGIAQPTVHRILSGQSDDPKLSNLRKLARALGTTIAQLEENHSQVAESSTPYNRIEKRPVFKMKDLESEGATAAFKMTCPVAHSPETYGAIVPDNTMESTYGPSYPEGSIIFVDPERAEEARHGDLVVFRLSDSGVVGFKRLVDNDTGRGLEPLNIRYPLVPPQDFEIIGLVIGCWIEPK